MKKVNRISALVTVFIVTLVFSGLAIGSPANSKSFAATSKARNDHGTDIDAQSTEKAMAGVVSAANRRTYRIAKDFAFAISDSKSIDSNNESLNFAIVDLVYLIDAFEGQSEAVALQSILKATIRGTDTADVIAAEIKAVSDAYFSRLTLEQRWYFKVGQSQVNLMLAGWANDSMALKTYMRELQGLAKTAPAGTDATLVAAINGVGKYMAKVTFTKEDFTAVVNEAKIITTQISA